MAPALSSETIHASTVAIGGRAVLICGRSGAGKSDLAMRLIDRGAVLVADDYTWLRRRGTALHASPPATIAGKIELRGVGILDLPHLAEAAVALMIALADRYERLPPDGATQLLLGLAIPFAELVAWEASAPLKVERLLARIGQ